MKFKKSYLIDLSILLVPLIMIIVTPYLPEKVLIQWNLSGGVNRTVDRGYAFLLGLIPLCCTSLSLKYRSNRG